MSSDMNMADVLTAEADTSLGSSGQPFLELAGVSHAYRGCEPVVRSVSLAIEAGTFHSLIGRSGCGKTTLLKLGAGLLKPCAGRVLLQGRPLNEPDDAMGFVFQAPILLDWLNVLDNVLLPVSLHKNVNAEQRAKALALLAQLGLDGLADRFPLQLSGGQQSRVAIARALVTAPSLLFMDEPFAALDAITRAELQQDLIKLCKSQGVSVLFVTHDIAEAVYMADAVSVMHAGRIAHQMAVDLPYPREAALRFTPAFNSRCASLAQAMEEAR